MALGVGQTNPYPYRDRFRTERKSRLLDATRVRYGRAHPYSLRMLLRYFVETRLLRALGSRIGSQYGITAEYDQAMQMKVLTGMHSR